MKRWIVLAVALAAGCPPPPNTGGGSTYGFDTCDTDGGGDTLCGFIVESGNVSRVRTFTAGDYGLQLSPGAAVRLPFSWGTCFSGSMSMLAKGDSGCNLQFEVLLSDAVQSMTTAQPSTQWQQINVMFPPGFRPPTDQQVPFVALRITNIGTANCTIDEVSLDSPGNVCPNGGRR